MGRYSIGAKTTTAGRYSAGNKARTSQPSNMEDMLALADSGKEEKVGALTRLFNVLSAFEPGDEAATLIRTGDAGKAGKQYLSEVTRGLGSALPFLDKYTKPKELSTERKGFSDALTALNWNPQTTVGKIAKGGVGLAGDIALDPGNLLLAPMFKGIAKGVQGVGEVGVKALAKSEKGSDIIKAATGAKDLLGEAFVSGYKVKKVAPELADFTNKLKRAMNVGDNEAVDIVKKLVDKHGIEAIKKAPYEIETGGKLSKASDEITKLIKSKTAKEIPLGIRKTDVKDYFPRKVVKEPFKGGFSGGVPDIKPTIKGAEKGRVFKTLAEGEKAGYKYLEAPESLSLRLATSQRAVKAKGALNQMVAGEIKDLAGNSIVRKAGEAGTQGMKAFTRVKELKDYVAHPDVVDYLEKVQKVFTNDDTANQVFKVYDKIQNMWKGSVTSFFPAFHVRNAIGNIFNNFVAGVKNPISYTDAGKLQKGKGLLTDDLKKIFPDSKTFEEARKIMAKLGVTGEGQFAKDVPKLFKKVSGTDTVAKKLAKLPRKVGNVIEDNARIAHFIEKTRGGMGIEEASKSVNKFLFDYGDLSDIEQNMMKRIFPFYCVPETSEILTKNGWKNLDELIIGENVLTYSLKNDQLEWNKLNNIAIFDYDQDIKTWENKRHKLYFTDNHRWVYQKKKQLTKHDYGTYEYPQETGIVEAYKLNSNYYIKTISEYKDNRKSLLTVDEARLLGWLLSDGYFRWRGNCIEAIIYQHPSKFLKEVKKVAGGKPRKPHPVSGVIAVPVTQEKLIKIKKYLKRNKRTDDWVDIVTQLSRESLEAMYDAMYKGDGNVKGRQLFYACQLDGVARTFEVLATLLGYRVVQNSRGFYVSKIQTLGIKDGKFSREPYFGRVWCPKTNNETWVMKQGKLITITGNTFSRKNIPLQLEQIFKQPKKYKAIGDAIAGLQSGDLTAEEKRYMPDYISEKFGISIGRSETDYPQMLAGLGLPLEDVGKLSKPLKSLLDMTSPLIKTPAETATGRSFFYDSEIRDTSAYNATTKAIGGLPILKQLLEAKETKNKQGDTYYRVNPKRMYLLKSLLGRFVSTGEKLTDARKDFGVRLLDVLSGVKIYTPNIEKEKEKQIMEMLKELGVAKTFTRDYIPANTGGFGK